MHFCHRYRLMLAFASMLSGCTATQAWFSKPMTQVVIADGCQAAAADDNRHNAIINAMAGNLPKLAPLLTALNEAHLAIQAGYARCVADAAALATAPGQP